jgi:serine protease Do
VKGAARRLSQAAFIRIVRAMKLGVLLSLLVVALTAAARAEVIQLRDKAAVTGAILSEKRDQVIVDLGFTVLTIPRSQIVRIIREEELPAPATVSTKQSKEKNSKTASSPTPPLIAKKAAPEKQGMFSVNSTPPPEGSVRELVNQLGEAVVQVRTPGGLGSGFFINEEGYLITNFHVIEGETQISLEVFLLKNGQLERTSYKQIRIVAMNKFQDLALLKVEDKDAPKFSYVALSDPDVLAVGESVFAIGSPLGLERTVTEGIVSTKTRQMQGELYLQTTAQINPGNSGGPLFNLRGEAVGVTNMKINFGEGIGFAIPMDAVKRFLNHRDAYAYDNDNPSSAYRYLAPPSRLLKATGEK